MTKFEKPYVITANVILDVVVEAISPEEARAIAANYRLSQWDVVNFDIASVELA